VKSDEQRLVERAQAGSQEAFTVLVRRYQDRLLRFLALRCGVYQDAEDAVQSALLNAWRYLPSYDPRWQFSTWLYRIGLRELARPEPGRVAIDESMLSVDNALPGVEAGNVWRLATELLSTDARSALWLRYGEDASIREIATIMSRSSAWVKVSLMRSRRTLAARVQQEMTA
jgi:RNA polymerase sigma-70 factor (ECF subfamily)